jgi:hypothetical protein
VITILSLWMPILLSAVAIYIVSSIIHMALPYHKSDYSALPDEDQLLELLRKQSVGAGNYVAPYCATSATMRDPAFKQKIQQGPMLTMYVKGGGGFNMAGTLGRWFAYTLVVSFLAAYLCSRTLQAGADYLTVFRVAGFAVFLAIGGATPIHSIWYGQKWSSCAKSLFDALVYGLLAGGIFGWLWPR